MMEGDDNGDSDEFDEIDLDTTPNSRKAEKNSPRTSESRKKEIQAGGREEDDDEDEDDSFQEIALDAAPVEGLLHYHGRKSPSRRVRRRRFKRTFCRCSPGLFEAFVQKRKSTATDPIVSIDLVDGLAEAQRNATEPTMFQLTVKGDSMVYHFSVPMPNTLRKSSSIGFDDDDDADADADFNDGFDDDPAGSPPPADANSRTMTVAEWLEALRTHTRTRGSRAGGRGGDDYIMTDFSPGTDTSAIDLPSMREMSPAEALRMELDGLDLTEQDRVHLSRHNSIRDMDSAKKRTLERTPSQVQLSPLRDSRGGTPQRTLAAADGGAAPKMSPIVRHISGLGDIDIADRDLGHATEESDDDSGSLDSGDVVVESADVALGGLGISDSGSRAGDGDRAQTTTGQSGHLSNGGSNGSGEANEGSDDVEEDPALVLRRQRHRRFSRPEKLSIIMSGTVEKLASVAPIFSKRTVILHVDRFIFTRGVGTVNAAKEVFLKDVVRIFRPDEMKKPHVFKVEARKRTKKGDLKKGTVTHTFRCENSDEWVDKIDTLLQAKRTPKIN